MAKSNRELDYVIQAAKKRRADPMGFGTTRDERFAISPEKIAHDVIGDSFFTMTKTQREYVVELVRSGDLTSSEIAEEAKYSTPYDPSVGLSEQELTRVDPRGLRMSEDQRSMPVKEMSQKEFYKTFFGYDYKEEEIPQKVREIYSGLTGMPVDATPKTKSNLPKQRSYHPDYLSGFQQQKIALAQGGNVATLPANQPFFNPEPISYDQYSRGPVDFYNQALDTSSGIDVDPINEDEDEDENPNIYNEDTSEGDNSSLQNAMSYTISSTSGKTGYNPTSSVTNYSLDDINFGNTDVSRNTYSFTSPGEMTMDPATGDMNYSFSSMFDDYQEGLKAGIAATSKQVTSGGKFDASSLSSFGKSIGNKIDALAGATTVSKPFGTGPSAINPGIAGAPLNLAFPIAAPLMGVFGSLNVAQQARNAAAFQATGGTGGALMDVNGMMVSRPPGASSLFGFTSTNYLGGHRFVYSGNTSGLSDDQLAAMEAKELGFVPGTLTEVYDPITGAYKKDGVVSKYIDSNEMGKVGGTYNPATGTFVDLNGNSSAMGTEQAAKSYVSRLNNIFGSNLSYKSVALGRSRARAEGISFQDYMEQLAVSKGGDRARADAITGDISAVTGRIRERDFSDDGGDALQDVTKEGKAAGFTEYGSFGYEDDDSGNGDMGQDDAGGSSSSNDNEGRESDDGSYRLGGRVGMQLGGPAGFAERPEFVGGNQRPTDQQSIADDQPREVQEGTFVINSAAADEMGRDDVEKMIRQAYQKAGESGMGAGQQGISQEVAIAVSRGEVTIPPHIAKIIGYDRLKKINNRGKKEVSRRQQERQQAAGGGFISRKKLAEGGMPLPKSKPERVNHSGLADVELRADLEVYIQNDPLARLGFNLYEKGDVDVKAIIPNPRATTGAAGLYTPIEDMSNPGILHGQFERKARQQGITKFREDVPRINYFVGESKNFSRESGNLVLLHELRHHAMRHLNKKYKVPLPELQREETLMDVQDYANRIQARKVKPSIRKRQKAKEASFRKEAAYLSPSANKELAMYQKIAEEVLKDRKVPKRTKSKEVEGFFTRAMGILGL